MLICVFFGNASVKCMFLCIFNVFLNKCYVFIYNFSTRLEIENQEILICVCKMYVFLNNYKIVYYCF